MTKPTHLIYNSNGLRFPACGDMAVIEGLAAEWGAGLAVREDCVEMSRRQPGMGNERYEVSYCVYRDVSSGELVCDVAGNPEKSYQYSP